MSQWYTHGMARTMTTVRLSEDARQMQQALAAKLGLSLTGTLELALRKLAEAERIEVKPKPKRRLKPRPATK